GGGGRRGGRVRRPAEAPPGGAGAAIKKARVIGELREAVTRREDADRRKDEFLAMLGHELRNPLAPIMTALELMKLRGGSDAERERAVIERQARHLSSDSSG